MKYSMRNEDPGTTINVLWWVTFIVLTTWAHHIVPGVDFFIPGFIASMQEDNKKQTLWLIVAFTLLQDGTSLMAFGPSLLWYACAAGIFQLGRCIFEAENIVFIAIIAAALGALHYGLLAMMGSLQGIEIRWSRLATEGIIQAATIPPVWFVLYRLRSRFRNNVRSS